MLVPFTQAKSTQQRAHGESIDYDVLICGASFAGLSVAREIARRWSHSKRDKPRILLIDRYAIGDRPTSACAAPTDWLTAMDCQDSVRQTFGDFVFHTPYGTARYHLPFTFSTFDYGLLCEQLFASADVPFERATVRGRSAHNCVETDRGKISATVIVDCMGWQGVLRQERRQPPRAPLSRGLEVHPAGSGSDLEIWIDRSLVPAGYAWSFPAADEIRAGVGSYDPHFHVRKSTQLLAARLQIEEVNYEGNWIPHKLNSGTEDGIFFVGDSAGQCLPLTAEGIRTAFYFGLACGREIGRAMEGRLTVEQALRRYEYFCRQHDFQFKWMLRVQKLVPKVPPRVLQAALKGMQAQHFVNWSFGHYFKIAHPSYAWGVPAPATVEPLRDYFAESQVSPTPTSALSGGSRS